ncbi:hypothetical protein [Paraburkholderia atlantica]|uniref:hypothetical protein n=1 Tax=Paraburkholderia atlantica TaxID=2654982 RepID=UPI001614CD29|nr:hypothetical protein [Paraburkholderia atlantica]MBB5510630.1 hypothetical protein [Paraburkholderia atlantica]
MDNEIILVAGIDYPKFDPEKTAKSHWELVHQEPRSTARKIWNWRKCAFRVAAASAHKYKRALYVTLFDFAQGTRETWLVKGGNLRSVEIERLGEPNYANYRIVDKDSGKLFPLQATWPRAKGKGAVPPSVRYFPGANKVLPVDGPIAFDDYEKQWKSFIDRRKSKRRLKHESIEKMISITNVYDYVLKIGEGRRRPDGRAIRELHFFCHAFEEGPVLVNTPDLWEVFLPGESKERDPFDTDGRSSKDFADPNLTSEQRGFFRNAFADDGFAFLWGCNRTFFWKELIRQTFNQQRGDSTDEKRMLRFHRCIECDCWGDEERFNRELTESGKPKELYIRDIRQMIQDHMYDCYAQRLADAIDKPAIGALPGTSSDPDKNGTSESRLWHVPMGRLTHEPENETACLSPEKWTKWLAFYQHEMKVEFDKRYTFKLTDFESEFGRGFARFLPLVK